MSKIVKVADFSGSFAQDKDAAKLIRIEHLEPMVKKRERAVVDFSGVDFATQSFLHALLAGIVRTSGEDALEFLAFKGCNEHLKGMITTVIEYNLE